MVAFGRARDDGVVFGKLSNHSGIPSGFLLGKIKEEDLS